MHGKSVESEDENEEYNTESHSSSAGNFADSSVGVIPGKLILLITCFIFIIHMEISNTR